MVFNFQRGVSLIVSFLVMTIMLAIVLGISIILFNEIKTSSTTGISVSSFYAAESGGEKTLYFDRHQVPSGANRGLCNICNACSATDCMSCTLTNLATNGTNGCDVKKCFNCEATYTSTFDTRSYSVDAKVTTPSRGNTSFLNIISKGSYKNVIRFFIITITTIINGSPPG